MSIERADMPCLESAHAMYVHVPFCVSKCSYCDFNSYPGMEWLRDRYRSALQEELRLWLQLVTSIQPIATLYIGGGTPTLLGVANVSQFLESVFESFRLQEDAEVTIETNPGVADAADVTALMRAGVNRVSMGVQSFDDRDLRCLGRAHDAEQARESWGSVRHSGCDNMSLDLMYGLPGQTPDLWRKNLEKALTLQPEHLSLYALSVEEGTPLFSAIARGEIMEPDPDHAAEMYSLAEDVLGGAGYLHYEISNWALPGRECRHNLHYWKDGSYFGLGAGAHAYLGACRIANEKSPWEYIRKMEAGQPAGAARVSRRDVPAGERLREFGLPVSDAETIDDRTAMAETMMLGLRLAEGVKDADFRGRFGWTLDDIYGAQIRGLVAQGLLEQEGDTLRLTRRGRLLGNQVFCRFV